jgi:hypothetical protein
MARYLEIARQIVAEQGSLQAEELSATSVVHELPVADPYAERMRAALQKINQPNYPAGMIRWLDIAHPVAYAELTSHLPDEIHRLWTERAPLEQFEAVLSRLDSLHEECCSLCRAAQKDSTSVPKTSEMNSGTSSSIGDAG